RINELGRQRGMKAGPMMHSRGYGNYGPLVSPGDKPEDHADNLTFELGTAWMWKPHAYNADECIYFRWGGCVLVTERGGEPLVRRATTRPPRAVAEKHDPGDHRPGSGASPNRRRRPSRRILYPCPHPRWQREPQRLRGGPGHFAVGSIRERHRHCGRLPLRQE